MNEKVLIYEHANFGGASQELTEGTYDLSTLKIGNDQLSSLKVPQGLKVTLFEHGSFAGRTKEFTQDAPYVGDDFNDATSSIRVERIAKVVIYADGNFSGASQDLVEGNYDLAALKIGNDQLSSLKVPAGFKVTLYEHGGFAGRTKVFTQDASWVGDDFNDTTSGIRVERIAATATVATVPVNNAMQFINGNGYLAAQLNVSESAFTMSMWFKTTNANCGLFSVDLGDRGAGGHDRHLYLKGGAIAARLWSNETIQTGSNKFADGRWHKVTYVFGGEIGGHRIYVDGRLEAKGTKAFSDFTTQDGVNIGYSNDAINPYFDGCIAEVSIWSIARAERDIVAEQEVLKGNEKGLQAYWKFCDGKDSQIVDRTAGKAVATKAGDCSWTYDVDLSGSQIQIAKKEDISNINAAGVALTNAVKSLGNGYKSNTPAAPLNAQQAAQSVSPNTLAQYNMQQRVLAAIQNGTLTFSKDLLGEFGAVADAVSGMLKGAIRVNNVGAGFVKITPGNSGTKGEAFTGDLSQDITLANANSAALQIWGDVTLFSTLGVSLEYAEFSQMKGVPYGVFKFKSPSIGLGTFMPDVPLLGGLSISDAAIIASSADLYDATLDAGIARGFNFFGKFRLASSNDKAFRFIGNLLGVPEIQMHGVVDLSGLTPAFLVEAVIPIDKYVYNGKNFKFRMSQVSMGLEVKGKPLEPSVLLANELIVTLGSGSSATNLVFTGGIKLEPESVSGSFTMQAKNEKPYTSLGGTVVSQGEWKNPFGIPGITIRELAVQLGGTYIAPWIDNVGIHGNMKIGDIDGSMSVLVDTNDPDQFVIAGATDKLTMVQIMTSMSVPTFVAYQATPQTVKDTLNKVVDVKLEDVKVYIVPSATSIGAIKFDKEGVTIQGKLSTWGWHASASINVSKDEGLDISAEMDAINLKNIFKVTGAKNDPAPMLMAKLSPSSIKDAKMKVSGKVSFLGLSSELFMEAGAQGMSFLFRETIAGVLENNLTCTFGNGNLSANGSINFHLNVNLSTIFGTIPLVNVGLNATAGMSVGVTAGFLANLSGSFQFYGKGITMPSLTLNIAPNDFRALYNAVVKQISDNANTLFKQVFGTLAQWADAVKNGTIQYAGEVARVAKDVYQAAEKDVIAAYKTLGKGANEIASGFKSVYGYSEQGVAIALKGAGFAVDQVGGALKSAFNTTATGAATALKGAGYAVDQVGSGVKSAYNLTADGAATALKGAGFAVNEVGNFVKNTYGLGADALNKALSAAGYAGDQIKGFFSSLGGSFTDFFGNVGNKLDPTKW